MTQQNTMPPVYLLGSDVQPSVFLDLTGERVQLGQVVKAAFVISFLPDVNAWNNLPSEKREEYIQDVIDGCYLVPIEASPQPPQEGKD